MARTSSPTWRVFDSLAALLSSFRDLGVTRAYYKPLAANDNSKNQIYMGGSFEAANLIPIAGVVPDRSGKDRREVFKASVILEWLSGEGSLALAPRAQLILYPQYPEVRLSGFLAGSRHAPSDLLRSRAPGRVLVLGVGQAGRVFGHCCGPADPLAEEIIRLRRAPAGFLFELPLRSSADSRSQLLAELQRIHLLGWIDSKRLSDAGVIDCQAPQCGGYTLEAELGIRPNGYSEPDFLGWEVKQHAVPSFAQPSGVLTLMTPEPDGGFYRDRGAEDFVRRYGYLDKRGRADRMNFGGLHRVGSLTGTTGMSLHLAGFDRDSARVVDAGGGLQLVSQTGEVAASWSFAKLLAIWGRKHAQAVYVMSRMRSSPRRQYRYGSPVSLGKGTTLDRLLFGLASGHIYYDPGIKLEGVSSLAPKTKRRSQFRIRYDRLRHLYTDWEEVDLAKAASP